MAGKKDKELAELFRKVGELLGKTYGSKGGKSTAKGLTPEQRTERARKAALALAKQMTKKQRSERARRAALIRHGKLPSDTAS